MKTPELSDIKKIHFVGIGGVGMSGIAEVMHNLGYTVTGSDQTNSKVTRRLDQIGIPIFYQHSTENILDCDVLVRSTAISDSNPELTFAKENRIPIIPRAQMLAELMRLRYGIAVAGTHGKTTTTSLLACIFCEADLDPTFVIGGQLNSAGTHAALGKSKYFIAEADESDASFLFLKPEMAVVTNIDEDHMETYDGNKETLQKTFLEFLHHLPLHGVAVLGYDCAEIQALLPEISRRIVTFGLNPKADIYASEIKQTNLTTQFVLHRKNKTTLPIKLNMPGTHNVLNALAAIAVATECDIKDEFIQKALERFQGVGRRFQIHGDFMHAKGTAILVEDYGHHPNEIRATIDAAKSAWPDKRIVMVFQPHRYSRTKALFENFAEELSNVDLLVMLNVYSAGEEIISDCDSRSLCGNIRKRGKVEPIFINDNLKLKESLMPLLESSDVIFFQGAGDVGKLVRQFKNAEG